MELLAGILLFIILTFLVSKKGNKQKKEENDYTHLYSLDLNNKSLIDIYGNKFEFDFNTKTVEILFEKERYSYAFSDLKLCKIGKNIYRTDNGSIADKIFIELLCQYKTHDKQYTFHLLNNNILVHGKNYEVINENANNILSFVNNVIRSTKTFEVLEFKESEEDVESTNCTNVSINVLDNDKLNIIFHDFFCKDVELSKESIENKVNTIEIDIIEKFYNIIMEIDKSIEDKNFKEIESYFHQIPLLLKELDDEAENILQEIKDIVLIAKKESVSKYIDQLLNYEKKIKSSKIHINEELNKIKISIEHIKII